jgi:hypothetical protein
MKTWEIPLALGLVVPGLAGPAAAACAPAGIVHIVTTETTPGIDPQSADAKPKSLFREGARRSRLEEQPDEANKVHALAVIDEPNIWMANLADRTGRHFVDPGPTFNTRAAVFSDDRISPRILDLEFGCEAAFIAANAPKVDRTETIDGLALQVHRFVDGTEAVEILEKPGVGEPLFARYYRSGKLVWAIRYDLYDTDAPSDPAMFTAPAGVKYEDVPIKP